MHTSSHHVGITRQWVLALIRQQILSAYLTSFCAVTDTLFGQQGLSFCTMLVSAPHTTLSHNDFLVQRFAGVLIMPSYFPTTIVIHIVPRVLLRRQEGSERFGGCPSLLRGVFVVGFWR
jgi:hypothetical protein